MLMLFGVYAYDYRRRQHLFSFSYWGLFVLLVVVAGIRYRIGTDSIIYERIYEDVPPLWKIFNYNFDSTRFEPAFLIFASIPKSFSPDFMWLQVLESLVVNLVVFWFVLKNSKNKFLSITLYYIVLYLNLNTQVLREALAVSLFLLAWPSFRDGKWLWYYCLTGLATFFHTSALLTLLLPIFCIPGIRQTVMFGKRTLFICIILLGVGVYMQMRFTSFFQVLAVTQRAMDRVNEYAKNEMSGNSMNIMGMAGTFIQYCLYPLIALYFANAALRYKGIVLKRSFKRAERAQKNQQLSREEAAALKKERRAQRRETRDFERWQLMVLMGVYFMIISIPVFIMRRYFNYFGMFCLVAVADWAFSTLIVKGKKFRLRPLYWAIVLFPFFFFNIYFYTSKVNGSGTLKTYQIYYPYNTRFDPEMDPDREAIYRFLDAR